MTARLQVQPASSRATVTALTVARLSRASSRSEWRCSRRFPLRRRGPRWLTGLPEQFSADSVGLAVVPGRLDQ